MRNTRPLIAATCSVTRPGKVTHNVFHSWPNQYNLKTQKGCFCYYNAFSYRNKVSIPTPVIVSWIIQVFWGVWFLIKAKVFDRGLLLKLGNRYSTVQPGGQWAPLPFAAVWNVFLPYSMCHSMGRAQQSWALISVTWLFCSPPWLYCPQGSVWAEHLLLIFVASCFVLVCWVFLKERSSGAIPTD